MKKFLSSIFIAVIISMSLLNVQAQEMEIRSIDLIITDIREDLNIGANDAINVEEVKIELLEELGDSVMEAYIGDSERHEEIDNYYGGDDSETLSELHIQLGKDYLKGYPITMMSFMPFRWNEVNGSYSGYYRHGMMGRNYGYPDSNDQYYGGMMGRNYSYADSNDRYYSGMMGRNYGYADSNDRYYSGMMGRNNSSLGWMNNTFNRNYGMMNLSSGGMIMGIFGFILLVVVLYYLFNSNKVDNRISTNNALDILKERYARGEISRDEFIETSKLLK